MTDNRPSGFRVLSFIFHASYSGRIALDGFGIVEKSFLTSRLGLESSAEQLPVLTRLLHRSIKRFHPAIVVLGVSRFDTPASRVLRVQAKKVLKALHVPVVTRSISKGYALLRDRVRGTGRYELARAIVEGFLPELRPELLHTRASERRMRNLWHVIAIALRELVVRSPRAAAALAQPIAFRMENFRRLLLRSELRHSPNV